MCGSFFLPGHPASALEIVDEDIGASTEAVSLEIGASHFQTYRTAANPALSPAVNCSRARSNFARSSLQSSPIAQRYDAVCELPPVRREHADF